MYSLTIHLRACGCAVSRLAVKIVVETATTGCESSKSVIVVIISVETKAIGVKAGEVDTRS
jgi:hypothetical protein